MTTPPLLRRAATLTAALFLLLTTAGVGAPAHADNHLPPDVWWYETLGMEEVWEISKGAGVTVAVIDSGVQADLPDLTGRVLPGIDLSGEYPDGRTDPPGESGPAFGPRNDNYGHGTDMAAIIAGTGAGTGFVGVAPEAMILPVRLRSDGDVREKLPEGITWAVDNGADIINISRTTGGPFCDHLDPELLQAIAHAIADDVILVSSSGNLSSARIGAPTVCEGVLAIGAIDADANPWAEQTSGPELDFVAPGVDLPALLLNSTLSGLGSGTSVSSAIVSGVLALLRSHFPDDSARDLVTRVLWHVHNGPDTEFGERISDDMGYGVPLPWYALTKPTDLDAANPIYDRIEAWMAATFPEEASDAASTESENDDSGLGALPILLGIAALVALVLIIVVVTIVLITRNRTPAATASPAPTPPPAAPTPPTDERLPPPSGS